MFKFVVFAALMALAAAKPLVVEYEYPVAYTASYSAAPVAYSYSPYDYAYPYSAYTYAAPYSYYEYLRK